MATDPLGVLFRTLDLAGYDPRGAADDFRARCPGHDGDNASSLQVRRGVDGRALLTCHAHDCDPLAIITPLGLAWRDLFVQEDGAYRPSRRRQAPMPDMDATVVLLAALAHVGIDWTPGVLSDGRINTRFFSAARCPACGEPDLMIHRLSPRCVQVGCWAVCSQKSIRAALRLGALVP